jgi:iron complex outermembrane receptor protein
LKSLEATVYHIDWSNVQITGLSATPGITALITRNTKGIENWGIELSAQAAPAAWLNVEGALSFTHPRFKQGSEDPGSNGYCGLVGGATASTLCRVRQSEINPRQLVPDISGNVPARTVQWSWALDVAPQGSVFRRMRLHLGLSYQSNVNDRQIGGLYYGEHMLLDGKVTFPLGPVALELWGTNLTNTRYIRVAAGSSGPQFFINQPRPTDLLLSEGRRIGVTLRYPD